MDRYNGYEEGVEMDAKTSEIVTVGKNIWIQALMMSFCALLTVSCSSGEEQLKPSQPVLPATISPSPSPSPSPFPSQTTDFTPTPTLVRWTATPTNALHASSTPRPPSPTRTSDNLIPADMTAVNETQEAYERILLLTPSPTPTLDVPLNENGPWLVNRTLEDVIAMNLDGTGLTRMTVNPGPHSPFQGPQSMTITTSGNWLALTIGKHPDSRDGLNPENAPYDLAIQLLRLPLGKYARVIPLLSTELIQQLKQDEVEPVWTFPDVFYTLLNSPILWSPNGRYLAFVAALDGPSSDLYVYDTATDQIRRLTSGPNEAFLLSWSPDSRWILHVEATSYSTRTVLTSAYPRAKAVWIASPDGSQVRKIHDADDEMIEVQGWLSPNVYVEQTYLDWSPYYTNIRTVDILNRELASIFPCFGSVIGTTTDDDIALWSFGYDEDWIYRFPQYTCDDPLAEGFYALKDGNMIPLSYDPEKAHWKEPLEKFIVYVPGGIEIWDLSGQLTMAFSVGNCDPQVSPDRQWLAFWSPCGKNLQHTESILLYNSQGDFVKEYDLQVDRFSWKQDSSGIYFEVGDQLWFQSLQDNEPVLIHPDSGIYPPIVVGE
jgi:hypothetical protein